MASAYGWGPSELKQLTWPELFYLLDRIEMRNAVQETKNKAMIAKSRGK